MVGQEIVYVGISSSGVIWQQKIRTRFRPFVIKANEQIESAYQEWMDNGKQDVFVDVNESSINFHTMVLRRKKKAKQEMKIRRSFQNGLYLMYRHSAHQTQIHVKVNHLQIDNQVWITFVINVLTLLLCLVACLHFSMRIGYGLTASISFGRQSYVLFYFR